MARAIVLLTALTLLYLTPLPRLQAQSLGGGSLAAVQARAQHEHKPVALYFTGGDWCLPALRLKAEVFDTSEFHQAPQNVLWVTVEFPQQEDQASAQDLALAARYGVTTLPQVVLTTPTGLPFARMSGYQPGGPQAYLADIKALLPQQGRLKALQKTATSPTALDALYREAERDGVSQTSAFAGIPQEISRLDRGSGGLGDRYRLLDQYNALLASWSGPVNWQDSANKLTKLAARAQAYPNLQQTILVTLGSLYFDALHEEDQAKTTLLQALALGDTPEAHQARRLLDRLP